MQATFSAPVAVRGVPGIDLKIGERVVVARYVSGSGTDRLRFEYVIRLDDHDDNGIGLSLERDSESPFRLDGAAIVDAVAGTGIGVDLKRTTLTGGGGNHRVEARPPLVTGVSVASSPASGDTYGTGETVTVRLTMRSDVTVLLPGRPHVWLEVGGAVRRAEYSGPVGSATRDLEFSYTVQEGDLDTVGVRLCSSDRPGIDCGRIHLNGGTIRASRGGLDAELGTPNQSAQAGHKVRTDSGLTLPTSGSCSTEIKVPHDWALVPSGVDFGDKFRLLFVSSTTASGPGTTSDVYSGRMQALASNGHQAIRRYKDGFTLKRWGSFARFLDDGRICLTNNAAERALRPLCLGRRSWLFAGSDRGGERAAVMYTLIGTAKLNDVDPQAWLADVLDCIADLPQTRLDELLPWHWKAHRPQALAA